MTNIESSRTWPILDRATTCHGTIKKCKNCRRQSHHALTTFRSRHEEPKAKWNRKLPIFTSRHTLPILARATNDQNGIVQQAANIQSCRGWPISNVPINATIYIYLLVPHIPANTIRKLDALRPNWYALKNHCTFILASLRAASIMSTSLRPEIGLRGMYEPESTRHPTRPHTEWSVLGVLT